MPTKTFIRYLSNSGILTGCLHMWHQANYSIMKRDELKINLSKLLFNFLEQFHQGRQHDRAEIEQNSEKKLLVISLYEETPKQF